MKFVSSSDAIDKLRNLAIDNLKHNEFEQAEVHLNQLKQIMIYDKQFNEPLFDLNDLSQPITYHQFIDELLKFKYFAYHIENKMKH